MALSYVSYSGDGSTTAFAFGSIALLQEALVPAANQIEVYLGGTLQPASTYTINPISSELTFVTAPSAGVLIRIQRNTKEDARYVDWTNSTNLNQEQLNLDSDQLLFLTQENTDSNEASIRRGSDNNWDAEGVRIGNIEDGLDNLDAVNVQQLNAAVFGGTPGTVTGQVYISNSTGQTQFALASLHGQQASDVNVFLNGEKLQPVVDYTVADNPDGSTLDLTLTSVPSGLIEITFVTGILAAGLAEDAVDNDNIKDGVLTPNKFANTGFRQVLLNDPATGPEFSVLEAQDVVAANNVDIPTRPLNSLAVPTADVALNNNKITGLADPVLIQDGVNLQTLQNQIASVRAEISQVQDFKLGTIAGTVVNVQSTQRSQAGSTVTQNLVNGSFWFWFDPKGKDLLPVSNNANWMTYFDATLKRKDTYSPSFPLDADLTFMAKDPSLGSMDRELYDAVDLPADAGFMSPGSNPGSGTKIISFTNNSVYTAGGKIWKLQTFKSPRDYSVATTASVNFYGTTALPTYTTNINPSNNQTMNGDIVLTTYSFVRVG